MGKHDACLGSFSSSDGMRFSSRRIYYDSPAQARRELQKTLKNAIEIVSRKPLFDDSGREVGESVVALFPADSEANMAELIIVKDADFLTIGSSSLRNITEYQKELKP